MTRRSPVETKLTRRSLLCGVVTPGGGAARARAVPSLALPVAGVPAAIAPKLRVQRTASASQNIVDTGTGKIYDYSRYGAISYLSQLL